MIHEAPEAAVPALIAVIAHGKIFPRRHYNFIAPHELLHVVGPFGLQARGNHLARQRRKVVVQRVIVSGRIVHDIRLIQQLAIHINGLVHDFHPVARQADHALHKVLMFLVREFKDDDVTALEWAVGQNFFVPSAGAAKNKLVDQQMVADQQGAFHGSGGHFEGLRNKSRAKQGQNHGNEE